MAPFSRPGVPVEPDHGHTVEVQVRWDDLDPIGHMRHSAYAALAAHARLGLLTEREGDLGAWTADGVAPVLLAEHLYYRREFRLGESILIASAVSHLTSDGSRWSIRHSFYKQVARSGDADASHAELPAPVVGATVEVEGGWIDMSARKLGPPGAKLFQLMAQAPRTSDFRGDESHT